MTRAEQERLVERYLGGQMNSAQEEEFFIMVAVDHDLRQTLKAYRIVESAIRKHRDTVPIHHGASRARVMAMLNADAVATQHGGDAVMGTTRQASRPMWGLSASAARWAVASVAATALVVGAFVVAPLIEHKTEPVASQLRITPAQQAPIRQTPTPVTGMTADPVTPRENTPLPQAEAPPATVSETAERRHASPDVARHGISKESRSKPPSNPAPVSEPKSDGNDTTPSLAPASKPAEPTVTTNSSTPSSSKPEGRTRVIDSTARVRLQLDLPK